MKLRGFPEHTASEKHHLVGRFFGRRGFFPDVGFHFSELPVGDAQQSDASGGGQSGPDAFAVDFTGFLGGTVLRIDGKLEHVEALFDEFVPEDGIAPAIFLGDDGEVEEGKEPHAAILR